ncbi:hypothetical protein CBM2587_A250007 [Cupriavidus taiwanensis]|uniref:Uncharacterized protein n=1 Tax=Cupriavidus taiwanensis TaxID=164546 RepID=A0A375BSG0_9BURK|nr:hypothetical protein CBM2587_A250007 [Cupriavidus taiwanensis]
MRGDGLSGVTKNQVCGPGFFMALAVCAVENSERSRQAFGISLMPDRFGGCVNPSTSSF